MKKRLLACLLTAAMLVSLFPLPALAAEVQRPEWMVTAFDPLDGDIAAQTVPQGGEPVLPDSLTAYAYVIEDDTAVILPSEGLAQEDEQSQSDGPEDEQLPPDSTEEPPAPGEYTYTPVLPAVYEVAGEVELPVIFVTVTAVEQTALQRVQAMIDTLPTAEELSGMSEVYNALQAAYDAYEAMTDGQKEEIIGAEIFNSLFAFFNGMVNLLEAQELSIENGPVTIADCVSGCPGHTITGTGTSTTNTITVLSGTHDITLQSVNIDVSERYRTAAFSIAAGATVNLTLNGENTLTSGYYCAGLQVPGGAALVITKGSNGSLDATCGGFGAGIGGGDGGGGTITINGGTITATGGSHGAGIGGGYSGAGGTFTANGNAFIVADSISDQSGKEDGSWKGVIFEGDEGQVYGDSITLTTDSEIPVGKKLTIGEGQTLTVGNGVTLTVSDGAINVEPGGKLNGEVGGTVNWPSTETGGNGGFRKRESRGS